MHADEINGISDDDTFADDHDLHMSIMDRLMDYAPAGAINLDCGLETGAPCISSSSAHGALAASSPVTVSRSQSENFDERRAAAVLYGHRSGSVSPATPVRLRHSFCHCCDRGAA
jgi:hypothetical protein